MANFFLRQYLAIGGTVSVTNKLKSAAAIAQQW